MHVTLDELLHGQLFLVHTVKVLFNAVLVLGPIVAQMARIHGGQAAFDPFVSPAGVLGLVGASAAMAPEKWGAVFVGGA